MFELVPDWAPNLHPLIVHFPIALLLGAIGADLLSLVVRRWGWLRPATVALYVGGGVSAVLTYFTGTWAAEAVSIPASAEAVLSEHANLGWWTMWFFGLYALVRLGAYLWPKTRTHTVVNVVLLGVALGGGVLLYETGEHGAEMVYRYGVGVHEPTDAMAEVEPGLTMGESGWQWRPQSARAWTERVRWLEGTAEAVQTRLDTLDTGGVALATTPESPVLFVVPDTLGAVQVTAELNLDAFDGSVALVHHVRGAETYDFLRVSSGALRLGRRAGGTETPFAESTHEPTGWQTLRVVGDGTHFRGYVDGEMVVHGHGEAAPSGTVGMRLIGDGTVRLRRLAAESL